MEWKMMYNMHMTKSEEYFIELIRNNRIVVDPKTGYVYSVKRSGSHNMVGARSSSGYLRMSAGPSRSERYYILLHRLVWIYCKGEIPANKEVNHINGAKTDNRIENLEIVSRSENVKHALRKLGKVFGVVAYGGDRGGPNTPKEKIEEIISLYDRGLKNKSEISRMTGVQRTTVSRIINRIRNH